MTTFEHPYELQLSDWVDGLLDDAEASEVERHLSTCPECRNRVSNGPHAVALSREHQLGVEFPKSIVAAFSQEPPTPEHGQLWQVVWERVAQVVLLTSASSDSVTAVPAEADPELADDKTVVLPPLDALGSLSTALWAGLARDLPLRVLNVCLGSVSSDVLSAVADVQSGVATGAGAPITAAYDERAQVRTAIEERLDELARATWAPAVENAPGDQLADVARRRGLAPSNVADALGIAPGDARAVLSGSRSMEPSERDALAELVGLSTDEVDRYQPRLDPGLVFALDHPKYRSRLRSKADEAEMTEPDYRFWVATRGLARAARTARRGAPDWDQLIEDFLNAG